MTTVYRNEGRWGCEKSATSCANGRWGMVRSMDRRQDLGVPSIKGVGGTPIGCVRRSKKRKDISVNVDGGAG